jgi:putative ABC transport system permease protein
MQLITLASKSLFNRKSGVLLTVLAIALSVGLLLTIERVRSDIRTSFANTISGTDLIVGAKTGSVELLLYSVFRIGHPNNNLSWQSYQALQQQKTVAWTIPISLGDSHKGMSVVGTTNDYFEHYRYANKQSLNITQGNSFQSGFDLVLGAVAAKQLGYQIGSKVILAHGAGNTSFHHHDDHPFTVVGVLAPTGTPVDKALYVPLGAIDYIHGASIASATPKAISKPHNHQHDDEHSHEQQDILHAPFDYEKASSLSAVLVGLKNPVFALQVQRSVNLYQGEPLLAILPKFTLMQLWQVVGIFEKAMLVLSAMVVIVSLLGMLTNLLGNLAQRRRELAILRSVGASPHHIFLLLTLEAMVITSTACVLGTALYYVFVASSASWLAQLSGISLQLSLLTHYQMALLGIIMLSSLLFSLYPAYRAYRYSLSDGLSIKL